MTNEYVPPAVSPVMSTGDVDDAREVPGFWQVREATRISEMMAAPGRPAFAFFATPAIRV